jgi:hypothetical protein
MEYVMPWKTRDDGRSEMEVLSNANEAVAICPKQPSAAALKFKNGMNGNCTRCSHVINSKVVRGRELACIMIS